MVRSRLQLTSNRGAVCTHCAALDSVPTTRSHPIYEVIARLSPLSWLFPGPLLCPFISATFDLAETAAEFQRVRIKFKHPFEHCLSLRAATERTVKSAQIKPGIEGRSGKNPFPERQRTIRISDLLVEDSEIRGGPRIIGIRFQGFSENLNRFLIFSHRF